MITTPEIRHGIVKQLEIRQVSVAAGKGRCREWAADFIINGERIVYVEDVVVNVNDINPPHFFHEGEEVVASGNVLESGIFKASVIRNISDGSIIGDDGIRAIIWGKFIFSAGAIPFLISAYLLIFDGTTHFFDNNYLIYLFLMLFFAGGFKWLGGASARKGWQAVQSVPAFALDA